MISGFVDVSPSPKTIYFIFGDPRIPHIIQENSNSFLISFYKLHVLVIHQFWKLSKRRVANNPDPFNLENLGYEINIYRKT